MSITDAGMVESRKEEAEGRGEDGDEGFEDSTKGTKALICVLSCEPSWFLYLQCLLVEYVGVYFFVRVVEVQSSCTCMVTFGAQESNLFDAVELSLSLMKIPEVQIHAVIFGHFWLLM